MTSSQGLVVRQRSSHPAHKGAADRLPEGAAIWVKDTVGKHVWIKAKVLSGSDAGVSVVTDSGVKLYLTGSELAAVEFRNVDEWNDKDGLTAVGDLTSLTHLHEPAVLEALQIRFDTEKIYTFCGPILIAVNPFKTLKTLYNEDTFFKYSKPEPGWIMPPHIYAVSYRAYADLKKNFESQVLLISGESGAGKTESVKIVLRFLMESAIGDLDRPRPPNRMGKERTNFAAPQGTPLERKVLESNPLMEAFGNACTVRNSNSSRFGKFIELGFSGRLRLTRAAVRTYLLEKVRVIEVAENERSFHIFYQVCAAQQQNLKGSNAFDGLDPVLRQLLPAKSFATLGGSSRFEIQGVDDAAAFQDTLKSLEALGVPQDVRVSIIQVVVAVLHMGNIEFDPKGEGSEVKAGNTSLDVVCEMLQVEPKDLAKALTRRMITVGRESIESPLNLKQAEESRAVLALFVYSLLFRHIVSYVNDALGAADTFGDLRQSVSPGGRRPTGEGYFVGFLDIFGFESFEFNSFEQLCINFANERLQYLFNDHVFNMEISLYKQEGISVDRSDFPDNLDIIDLIQGKPKEIGIFSLLDEECRMPKGSDKSFCEKVRKHLAAHPRLSLDKLKADTFTVVHFAGKVQYSSLGFVDKNRDELRVLVKNALQNSPHSFVQTLLEHIVEPSHGADGKSQKKPFVSTHFKAQLEELIITIKTAQPHFVRCVKPNPKNKSDLFDRMTVVEQLRAGGVIEALHVQRSGYPCRFPHQLFFLDYRLLLKKAHQLLLSDAAVKQRVERVMGILQEQLQLPRTHHGLGWAVGETIVFLKRETYEALEAAKNKRRTQSSIVLQRRTRGWLAYSNFRRTIRHVTFIQAMVRGWRRLLKLRKESHGQAVQAQRSGQHPELQRQASKARSKNFRSLLAERAAETGRAAAMEQRRLEEAARLEAELKEKRRMEEARRREEEAAERERLRREEMDRIVEVYAIQAEHHEQRLHEAKEVETATRTAMERELEVQRSSHCEAAAALEKQVQAATLAEEVAKHRIAELQKELASAREQLHRQSETASSRAAQVEAQHKDEIQEVMKRLEQNARMHQTEMDRVRRDMAQSTQAHGDIMERQLADQRKDLEDRAREELELHRRQWEHREQVYKQMVQDAQQSTEDQELLMQQQLAGSQRQMDEVRSRMDERIKFTLETSTKAEELYSKHVAQIKAQLASSQESFRRQLQASQEDAEQRLAVCVEQIERLEMTRMQQQVALDRRAESMQRDWDAERSSMASRMREQEHINKELKNIARVAEPSGADRFSFRRKSTVRQGTASAFGPSTSTGSMAVSRKRSETYKGAYFLQPSLTSAGVTCEGEVGLWQEASVDDTITIVCLGPQPSDGVSVMLAAAGKSGKVSIFRINKTPLERGLAGDSEGEPVERVMGFQAHEKAITFARFGAAEQDLVTSSADCTVKIWKLEHGGEMLHQLVDSALVTCALPLTAAAFRGSLVVANGRSVLRVVHPVDGETRKVRLDSYVRALALGPSRGSTRVVAATGSGSVHTFEVRREGLRLITKLQACKAAINCLEVVDVEGSGTEVFILATCTDSTVCIMSSTPDLSNIKVLRRVKNPHKILPLQCCHVAGDGTLGFLAAGSEDKQVCIVSLENYGVHRLQVHDAPVVGVAATVDAGLLVSGDISGRLIFWRRLHGSMPSAKTGNTV